MNYQTMLTIIPTIQELVRTKLPLKESYALYSLAKEIEGQKDFFLEEEKKLIEKYNAEVSPEGKITFKDSENQTAFAKEYFELNTMEADIKVTLPIVIKMDSVNGSDLQLSAVDLMSLSGIVDFE